MSNDRHSDMDLPSKEDEGFFNTIKKLAPEDPSKLSHRSKNKKEMMLAQSYNTPTLDTRKKLATNPFQDSTENFCVDFKFDQKHESNYRGINSTPSGSVVKFYNPESEDVQKIKNKEKSEYSELMIEQEGNSENESNNDDTREL